ncbi:ribosome maturation factor RimM [Kiloniella laminariae]|uniref:Ribosome maturation factor RimM n=1 Tax=Kiloniella laminariae TaxID=454162 RepID=A0ABT4LMR1_9PROT|nr:ribosome maturation factor RimM [Kiloniella laminariae]MCZ4282401.1 ribosome maturation factor RimM [Kiloniella laminariae]
MALDRDNWICVGVIAGAHGVRGQVKIKSYTENPVDVASYGPVSDDLGNSFDIKITGQAKGTVLTQLKGVTDRDRAQEMRGTKLYVNRDLLPKLNDDGEYYYSDLVGLQVENPQGEVLGTVKGVFNFGAGDILEFTSAGGRPEMVSFTESTVPVVDLEGRRIVVALPEVVLGRED